MITVASYGFCFAAPFSMLSLLLRLQGGRSLGLTMYSLFFHLASISLAAAALIHAPLPSTTAPAVLRRQDSASGSPSDYLTVGYLVIGTLDDTTACMLTNCES